MILCPRQLIDLNMSNFEYLFRFFLLHLPAKNNNNIWHVRIDELPRTLVFLNSYFAPFWISLCKVRSPSGRPDKLQVECLVQISPYRKYRKSHFFHSTCRQKYYSTCEKYRMHLFITSYQFRKNMRYLCFKTSSTNQHRIRQVNLIEGLPISVNFPHIYWAQDNIVYWYDTRCTSILNT